jgi:hypothetical protein
MSLAAAIQITDQDIHTTSLSRGGEYLGQYAGTPDGRTFVYSRNGAVALAPGLITQAPAQVTNSVNQTVDAIWPIGTTQLTYTIGATAVAEDEYAGGYFVVNDGTGQGQYSLILGNTAATSTNSYSITINLAEPLTVALAATSEASLMPNLNSAVILSASGSGPGIPITGVPAVAVVANAYFWNQVGGYASVLSDGAIAKNVQGIPSNGTDGAVETRVDATVVNPVGYAPELTVSTEYSPFVLTLA